MSQTSPDTLIAAGAILAPDAKLEEPKRAMPVSVHRFRHPALGARPIVRICPEVLSAGTDIEMEILGCTDKENLGVLGVQKARAPGFPGWALVHDPEHASYALKIMERFKLAARRAKTKPGHAKTSFDEIAKTLSATVPHFLPSYYEEAGRAFVQVGTLSYAATCFGKAREAELVHGLQVDEEQRHASFVEFALAGAVTTKALSEYAKVLARAFEPEDAYRRFAALAIQRTAGGMPPWGGMARELRRMIKAAQLDKEAEEMAFLSQIINSPALGKAPTDFWKSYRELLVRICETKPTTRGVLLNLFPTPTGDAATFDRLWLTILEETGALAQLDANADPSSGLPNGGIHGWFGKLLVHVRRGWRDSRAQPDVFELVRQHASALANSSENITITGRWGRLDVDMLEQLLELDVEVTTEAPKPLLDLSEWAETRKLPERGRDPKFILAHPVFGPALLESIGRAMRDSNFALAARDMPSLEAGRRAWIEDRISACRRGGLPDLRFGLGELQRGCFPATFVDFPDLHQEIGELSVVDALVRTLRGGLFDELEWPALEGAINSFPGTPQGYTGAFPFLVLHSTTHARVVGPSGVLLDHELRLPKGTHLGDLLYSKGQLFVAFMTATHELHAYWSGAPEETFKIGYVQRRDPDEANVVLEDGSICFGGRPFAPGDRAAPEQGHLFCDGENFWVREWRGSDFVFLELDPRTGKKGRRSKPKVFEDAIASGRELDLHLSSLYPLPEECSNSPLGYHEGLFSWLVSKREYADASGRRAERSSMYAGKAPKAFLMLPASDTPRLLGGRPAALRSAGSAISSVDGSVTYSVSDDPAAHPGSRFLLGSLWWHLFEARDIAGSTTLREFDAALAERLVNLAAKELDGGAALGDLSFPKTKELVRAELPQITHEGLFLGVVAAVARAASLAERIGQTLMAWDPAGHSVDRSVTHPDDRLLMPALGPLVDRQSWNTGHGTVQLAAVSQFFERAKPKQDDELKLEESHVPWAQLVNEPRAIVFAAAASGSNSEVREGIATLLDLMGSSVFSDPARRFRLLQVKSSDGSRAVTPSKWHCYSRGGNDYFAYPPSRYWRGPSFLLESARSGTFLDPPGAAIVEERVFGAPVSPAFLSGAVALLKKNDEVPWLETRVVELVEITGLTRAEAVLLLLGLPNLDAYESNFLPKELRTKAGLKVTEAQTARATLKGLSCEDNAALFAAAVGNDPAQLWSDSIEPATRMAQAWVERFGKRPEIDPKVLVHATKHLPTAVPALNALLALADPDQCPNLCTDGDWSFDEKHELTDRSGKHAFDPATLEMVAYYVPYLFAQLPVGHPLRAGIPRALELCRLRLRADGFLLKAATRWYYGETAEAERDVLLTTFGFDSAKLRDGEPQTAGAVVMHDDGHSLKMFVHPGQLNAETEQKVDLLRESGHCYDGESIPHYRLTLGESFTQIAARVENTPVPPGCYEANPAISAAGLHTKVQGKLNLGPDAAQLYLQTLALLSPTRKDVLRWNRWKASQYTHAVEELMKRKLLLEAKRARAGRKHFLPGAWEALKSPLPALESWKLPMYGATVSGSAGLSSPLGQLLALQPLHLIFETAWARVEAGDTPRYEEVES